MIDWIQGKIPSGDIFKKATIIALPYSLQNLLKNQNDIPFVMKNTFLKKTFFATPTCTILRLKTSLILYILKLI